MIKKLGQKGAAPVLVLLMVVGLVGFLAVASSASFKNGLFASLFPKKESQAATTVKITGVAVNNSSTKIYFEPVAGAKDYRIYDVTSPTKVKYAGIKHLETMATFEFQSTNNDHVNPIYPLQVQSYTPAGTGNNVPSNPLKTLNDYPLPVIEWNTLGDRQPHQLVVEAVDQVGPVSPSTTYPFDPNPANYANNDNPPFTPGSQTMYGMNKGPTPDGKESTNGMGPSTNNPQVIASSAPFTVTADGNIKVIPSRSDASQTFFDPFDQAEAANLKLINKSTGVAGEATMLYKLNDGDLNKGWDIHYQAADTNLAIPFISNDHFMDVLFDEHPGASWATMAMKPQKNFDISNGKMLHMTEEVDSSMDLAGRRWLGFDFAPSTDPNISWLTGNVDQSAFNQTQKAFFIEIYSNQIKYKLFDGPTTTKNSTGVFFLPHEIPMTNFTIPSYQNFHYNGQGYDNRSRFDLFLTQTHLALYEDGSLVSQLDIPGGLPFTNIAADFSHYIYHSNADLGEEAGVAPWNTYVMKLFTLSEERHWDNMGVEVLPSSAVPANWNAMNSSLAGLIKPQVASPGFACPNGWVCSDIGSYPTLYQSGQTISGNTWTIHSAGAFANDPNMSYFIYQPTQGDSNLSTRLLAHANLSYWSNSGMAGPMIRQSSAADSPFYLVAHGQDGALHLVYRTTSGGSIVDTRTNISSGAGNSLTPIYLKVTRQGNNISGYTSIDGSNWTQIPNSTQVINMSSSALQGLVDWELQQNVSGFLPQVGSATFDNIFVSGVASSPTPSFTPSTTATPTPSPAPNPLPGDINNSKKVDILDYNLMITDYGATSGLGLRSDINNSGKVDILDYNLLITNYGKSIP